MAISDAGAPLAAKAYSGCCPTSPRKAVTAYRLFTLGLTFLAYTFYHMSRKPISIVKNELLNCTESPDGDEHKSNCTSFIDEMDGVSEAEAKRWEGSLDSSYLFAYAIGMFGSGFIAERVDLRYFLSGGMLLSGIFTMLFGFAYYWGIHSIAYFIIIQVIGGLCQTTGWPGVVTVVANWFGKGKKGLIMGIWNSHTSVGNIVGSLLAGAFVDTDWGLSFIVPGLIIASYGVITFFVLVPKPENVGIDITEFEGSGTVGVVHVNEESPLLGTVDDDDVEEESPIVSPRRDGQLAEDEIAVANDDPVDHDVLPIATTSKTEEAIDLKSNGNHHVMGMGSDASMRQSEESHDAQAITFMGALKIPGVVEFSLCLFFAKLVSYTFLYWLPAFIKEAGTQVSNTEAANLSTLFDVGGIIGGIVAGIATDATGKPATTCAIMLTFAIPMLFSYQAFGDKCPLDMSVHNNCYSGTVGLLMVVGLFVNGPYALITTAVSADLGAHPSLRGSAKALATVTSIIDGTGSIGAAIGPLIASAIDFDYIFYALMVADICALLLLSRLIYRELKAIYQSCRSRRSS